MTRTDFHIDTEYALILPDNLFLKSGMSGPRDDLRQLLHDFETAYHPGSMMIIAAHQDHVNTDHAREAKGDHHDTFSRQTQERCQKVTFNIPEWTLSFYPHDPVSHKRAAHPSTTSCAYYHGIHFSATDKQL